jgi:predicted DNA-binding transcriptional regulator AlpA
MTETEFRDAGQLERLTGTKASTWAYWASKGQGPPSYRLGRRRVWKLSEVLAWIDQRQEEPVRS